MSISLYLPTAFAASAAFVCYVILFWKKVVSYLMNSSGSAGSRVMPFPYLHSSYKACSSWLVARLSGKKFITSLKSCLFTGCMARVESEPASP